MANSNPAHNHSRYRQISRVSRVGSKTGLILKQSARFFARSNGINLSLETSADTELREINLCDAYAEGLCHIARRPAPRHVKIEDLKLRIAHLPLQRSVATAMRVAAIPLPKLNRVDRPMCPAAEQQDSCLSLRR